MAHPTFHPASGADAAARRRRRHAADRRLRLGGIAAISVALGLLAALLVTLLVDAAPSFTQTRVRVDFPLPRDRVAAGDWRGLSEAGVRAAFPDAHDPAELRAIDGILGGATPSLLRAAVASNPAAVGNSLTLDVPAADAYDALEKGLLDRTAPADRRRLDDAAIARFDALAAQGRVTRGIDASLFRDADSRFPESAGLAGAIAGSALALLVCLLFSFPVGVAAAIWLEEFSTRSRLTTLVEVNINNLAAVPSIIFGLFSLLIFIHGLGLPRATPLVAGLVLGLMTLPTVIIVTRSAVRAVPRAIREAATAVGASRHQVVLHHVLPLAMPGILTGTIIGLARALGETAPLLLIGMNAFIASPPEGLLDASTTLPTQIFLWAESAGRGFVPRTSAAILVLLGFLLVMNAAAIFLRQRLERTW